MLNGHEIQVALDDETSDGLLVVPKPEANALDGSSLDLRLGRWFLAFRQDRIASVKLAVVNVEDHEPKSPEGGDARPKLSSRGLSLVAAPQAPAEEDELAILAEAKRARQSFVPFGRGFVLHPGSFVLGATLEWMRLPDGLSAYVTGKSSLGRHGLVIETAAGIHPKFSGCLTLEIANVGEVPLEIFPGMVICQVFFHRTAPRKDGGPEDAGRFSGNRKPVLKTPSYDAVFERLVRGERPQRR